MAQIDELKRVIKEKKEASIDSISKRIDEEEIAKSVINYIDSEFQKLKSMGIQIPPSTEDNVKANTIGLLIHDIDRMGIENFAGNNDLLTGKIADSFIKGANKDDSFKTAIDEQIAKLNGTVMNAAVVAIMLDNFEKLDHNQRQALIDQYSNLTIPEQAQLFEGFERIFRKSAQMEKNPQKRSEKLALANLNNMMKELKNAIASKDKSKVISILKSNPILLEQWNKKNPNDHISIENIDFDKINEVADSVTPEILEFNQAYQRSDELLKKSNLTPQEKKELESLTEKCKRLRKNPIIKDMFNRTNEKGSIAPGKNISDGKINVTDTLYELKKVVNLKDFAQIRLVISENPVAEAYLRKSNPDINLDDAHSMESILESEAGRIAEYERIVDEIEKLKVTDVPDSEIAVLLEKKSALENIGLLHEVRQQGIIENQAQARRDLIENQPEQFSQVESRILEVTTESEVEGILKSETLSTLTPESRIAAVKNIAKYFREQDDETLAAVAEEEPSLEFISIFEEEFEENFGEAARDMLTVFKAIGPDQIIQLSAEPEKLMGFLGDLEQTADKIADFEMKDYISKNEVEMVVAPFPKERTDGKIEDVGEEIKNGEPETIVETTVEKEVASEDEFEFEEDTGEEEVLDDEEEYDEENTSGTTGVQLEDKNTVGAVNAAISGIQFNQLFSSIMVKDEEEGIEPQDVGAAEKALEKSIERIEGTKGKDAK